MPGIKFALGENVKQSSRPNQPGVTRRYPSTRMGVEEVIRDAFTRARDYKRTWDEYREPRRKIRTLFRRAEISSWNLSSRFSKANATSTRTVTSRVKS